MKNLAGEEKTLADFTNKAILVSFFFPTCPYCNQSFPEVQKIYDKYKGSGLSAVWINVMPAENGKIPAWQKSHNFTVPVLLGRNPTALQMDYDIQGTPSHYLLDKDGNVLLHITGYSKGSGKALEDAVANALDLAPKFSENPSESTVVISQVPITPPDLPGRLHLTRPAPQGPRMTVEEFVAVRPTSVADGNLVQFDCLGDSARLYIVAGGKRIALAIPDPNVVAIKGRDSGALDFRCGVQKPTPLHVEYEPTENKTLRTVGNIKAIEFK